MKLKKDIYLYILSFDGLSKVDLPKMKKLPAFSEFYRKASGCESVKSVYPTLTYCAHTSITTGVYPNVHGIINNTRFQPARKSPDWFWYDKDIKVETFQSVAKKAGYDILSLFWPVTAGSKDIKYNMPEIFANRKYKNQILVSLANGSKMFQYKLNSKFGHLRDGHKEPELDNFTHSSLLYSVKNYRADINMVHYIDLDSQRHEFGFSSKEADAALERLDKRLGELVETLKSEGIYEKSVIIVLGDHSSRDGHSNVYPNTLLRDAGLLKEGSDNMVKSFLAIAKSADGCAYIYAKKEATDQEILNALEPLVKQGIVEKIYQGEEISRLQADSECRFILEAADGYFFMNECMEKPVLKVEEAARRNMKAYVNNHGYSPDLKKDYETVFFILGTGIKENVFIDDMCIVDEGPTFAALLGLEMKNAQGRAKREFLED